MNDEDIVKKLVMYLIGAKVSFEYGMGFNTNKYYVEALKDIEKALKLLE
jgi:hypothetical protein